MDRRQRKTREAIFRAFTELLADKDFARITVGEIIDRADIGKYLDGDLSPDFERELEQLKPTN